MAIKNYSFSLYLFFLEILIAMQSRKLLKMEFKRNFALVWELVEQ